MVTDFYRSLVIFVLVLTSWKLVGFGNETVITTSTKSSPAPPSLDDGLDLSMDNLFAWCVVPFDKLERSPKERVEMLKDLGFRAYAYDWRQKHLSEMEEEWKLARENGLKITAIWMWIDANQDRSGELSRSNAELLQKVGNSDLKTQVWIGFHENYFQDGTDEEKVQRGVVILKELHERVTKLGCRVAFYNHGGWIGEPANQVKIIEASGLKDVGIVYNFHHAHPQLERLPEIITVMMPYLWAVNLNGMKKNGPKILPIGQGDREVFMLKQLDKAGYKGPFGILGHVEDADVRAILERNLVGLKSLELSGGK